MIIGSVKLVVKAKHHGGIYKFFSGIAGNMEFISACCLFCRSCETDCAVQIPPSWVFYHLMAPFANLDRILETTLTKLVAEQKV